MLLFFNSCFLGFCFGIVYDFFRITRIAIKTCAVIVFIEDLFFFIMLTIGSFVFIVVKNDGALRGFLITGIILGLILYFATISVFILKGAKSIIKMVKGLIMFIYKITLKPVVWVLKIIAHFFQSIYYGMMFRKMVKVAENYSEKQQQQDIITEFLQN